MTLLNEKKFGPFVLSLAKNKRYYFVLIILVFCLLFLKNISDGTGPTGTFADNELLGSAYSINPTDSSFIFSNNQSYKPGSYYHLTYNVKYVGWVQGSNVNTSNASINILVDSSSGTWQTVGQLKLSDSSVGYHEIYFKPAGTFSTFRFEGENIFPNVSQIFISNINAESLNISEPEQLAALNKTIIGSYDTSNAVETMPVRIANSKYDFIQKPREMGQIFISQDKYLQSVALKLHFVGNGGVGEYRITLRQASLQNGAFTVGDDVLASFSVTAPDAKAIYQDPSQPNIYRFPLYAKLAIGSYYYISIQNDVSFDIPNHLEVFGNSDNSYKDGYAYDYAINKKYPNFDIYLGLYGIAPTPDNNDGILPSETISDLGGGEYSLSYSEIADRFSSAWSTDDGINVTWSIPTVHYPSSLLVSLTPSILSGGDSEMSYSFDGKNWETATLSLQTTSKVSISPNINATTFYIRYQSGIFKDLGITGDLHD